MRCRIGKLLQRRLVSHRDPLQNQAISLQGRQPLLFQNSGRVVMENSNSRAGFVVGHD